MEYWRRWDVKTCNRMVRARTCSRSIALRWFLLLVSAIIYLSYVYLISRCDSAPTSYTCFLGALVLHFFEWVVDRGPAPGCCSGSAWYCLVLRPPCRISVACRCAFRRRVGGGVDGVIDHKCPFLRKFQKYYIRVYVHPVKQHSIFSLKSP